VLIVDRLREELNSQDQRNNDSVKQRLETGLVMRQRKVRIAFRHFHESRSEYRTEQSAERKNNLVSSTRKHCCPQERKQEHGNSEDKRDYTHPALFELCRRIGEEKHRGEQNSIREVLT
jgi:hypothetical protein